MEKESEQIRIFLQERLDALGRVSLVDAIAHFDFHNHALPNAWRVNLALANLSTPVARVGDGFVIEVVPDAVLAPKVQITDADLLEAVNQYRRTMYAE